MQPKLLIVDDREDNLFSIEAILEPDNYRFVRAQSGKEALKILLREMDFAMILMDVKMPGLNGFETASLIYEREKLKSIPIIFITAHNYGEEYVFKGYRAGAVDYISKPINPELLRTRVQVFVQLHLKNNRLLEQEQKLIAINKSLENEIREKKISEEKVKALNLELLSAIDRLEAANKDLDRFAFMASHDLQEPLRKIRTFGQLLKEDHEKSLNETGRKYLDRIQHAAERMQKLTNEILTFSKVTSTITPFEQVNLNVLMEEVLAQLDEEINMKGAKISVEKLPTVSANPLLMQPLFLNLVNNALKYSKKDVAPEIKIYSDFGIDSNEPKNFYCRIYVRDNGIGFDQKYAEQIFAMFKRLHSDSEYEGTGIGLALCKKIVEQHNGFISAKGKEDEGSTFTVSLPFNANNATQNVLVPPVSAAAE